MSIPKLDAQSTTSVHSVEAASEAATKDRDILRIESKTPDIARSNPDGGSNEFLERQALLKQELEHRLMNGLQVVANLLSLQSRAAQSPEAKAQLSDAAIRVTAISRVHRRLHLLDREEKVDLRVYIGELCADLSALLLNENLKRKIMVSGTEGYLPIALAIPLGFIVSELVTNSAKYTDGNISISVENDGTTHSLTVADEGLGLPEGFDSAYSAGLGMNIVRSFVKQIDGTLQFLPGRDGRGTCVTVSFMLAA